MKVCANCGSEDIGGDGETLCYTCEEAEDNQRKRQNQRRRMRTRDRIAVLRSLGMVRVRGVLGGVYWE